MRFNKILHPEIIMDRRGEDITRELYKQIFEQIKITGKGYLCQKDIHDMDANTREHFLLTYKFKQNKGRVYHSGADFLKAMSKISKELPVDLLPNDFLGYFSFADETIYDEADEIQGAYVYIGKGSETPVFPEHHQKKIIWISYVGKDPQIVGRLLVQALPEKIEEICKKYVQEDFNLNFKGDYQKILPNTNKLKERNNVFSTIINLVLYVNSIDCDLIHLPNMQNISGNQRLKMFRKGQNVNECTLPVTLVSWNYTSEKSYEKESTWVETFPRWQRCGPQLSQIKLIWVTAHERYFKNYIPQTNLEHSL